MSGVKGFPRTVLSTLISQVVTKLNTGLNLVSGGVAVSRSNPLSTLSIVDYRTSQGAATVAGKNYKAWVTCAGVAGKYAAIQIENPIGSEYTYIVIGANGYNSTGTMKWYPLVNSVLLTNNNGFVKNLKSDGAASVIKMNSQALDSKTANDSVGVSVTATTPHGSTLMMVGELYALTAGNYLRFEADTTNIGMTAEFTIIQIPNSEL